MSKGGKTQTTTQQVDIPDFLQPFLSQQASSGTDALRDLESILGGGTAATMVAPFNQDQINARNMARNFAQGGGGFLPTAQNTFLSAARGQPVQNFLPQSAFGALNQGAGGMSFLPGESLNALTRFGTGNSVPGRALSGAINANPVSAAATSALTRGAAGQPLEGTDALQRTAAGDFLFGGEGFNAALDAAIRRTQPNILSTFGRGGAGAATGGLAQAAMAQAAADAFAGLYGQERANQLGAANSLGNLGLANRGQQLDAAGMLANIGLNRQAQQIGAANSLGSMQLGALGQLGGLNQAQQQTRLGAAGQLAQLSDAERQRQLAAAGALPGLGMTGFDVLSRVGAQGQDLFQRQMLAPLQAQQMLLGSAGGGVPFASTFGQTMNQPLHQNLGAGLLGGALTGAQLGSVVPGIGTGIGAGLGALVGLLG